MCNLFSFFFFDGGGKKKSPFRKMITVDNDILYVDIIESNPNSEILKLIGNYDGAIP